MSLWLVRAGKHGEREQDALDNNLITIGWDEISDLSKTGTKNDLSKIISQVYPGASRQTVANWLGQLWRFIKEIKIGDLVALPLKQQSAITIGEITSDYQYWEKNKNIKHVRLVKWLKTIPRSVFNQDMLYSLGALQTVCQIKRHDAENRVKKLIAEEIYVEKDIERELISEEALDIGEAARDQIVKYVGIKFKGHSFARLVEAILQAQGYITQSSRPGPDGGIDILAAQGVLGFSEPKLCVQVKSSSSQIDVKVLRELQGVMSKIRANQGLLVSWGGFNTACTKEARESFFSIRLWDQGAIVEQILKNYEKLDDELKAELPLKRIWLLVPEEQ